MDSITTVAEMSEKLFSDLVDASPRKIREAMFSQYGIKTKQSGMSLRLREKKSERAIKLHQKFKETKTKKQEQICTELIRNWLYGKRDMLIAALDFLEQKHDNGLVEGELDFFKKLPEEKVKALQEHLGSKFEKEEVYTYLRFVEVPFLTK